MTTKHGIHPTIGIETVTPGKAAQWLGTIRGQRPLRQGAVKRYAREMTTGNWLLNGEAIKFDREGRLIDGQHRLQALQIANMNVQMLVVRGVDEGAMITLDTGASRSFNDAAVIAGREYPRSVAPIARLWQAYEMRNMATKVTATHQELQSMVEKHPQIVASARFTDSLRIVRSRCMPSVQGFVHAYASTRYDREMADSFMQQLNDGAQLRENDPIFHLRKRLIDENLSGKQMQQTYVCAISIKAWNAWLAGDTFGSRSPLRWKTGGEEPEAFPLFSVDESKPKRRKR